MDTLLKLGLIALLIFLAIAAVGGWADADHNRAYAVRDGVYQRVQSIPSQVGGAVGGAVQP